MFAYRRNGGGGITKIGTSKYSNSKLVNTIANIYHQFTCLLFTHVTFPLKHVRKQIHEAVQVSAGCACVTVSRERKGTQVEVIRIFFGGGGRTTAVVIDSSENKLVDISTLLSLRMLLPVMTCLNK